MPKGKKETLINGIVFTLHYDFERIKRMFPGATEREVNDAIVSVIEYMCDPIGDAFGNLMEEESQKFINQRPPSEVLH